MYEPGLCASPPYFLYPKGVIVLTLSIKRRHLGVSSTIRGVEVPSLYAHGSTYEASGHPHPDRRRARRDCDSSTDTRPACSPPQYCRLASWTDRRPVLRRLRGASVTGTARSRSDHSYSRTAPSLYAQAHRKKEAGHGRARHLGGNIHENGESETSQIVQPSHDVDKGSGLEYGGIINENGYYHR